MCPGHGLPRSVGESIVPERSREAETDQVRLRKKRSKLTRPSGALAGKRARIGEQTCGKTLVLLIRAEGISTTDRIPDAVIEAAHARSEEVQLAGVRSDGVVGRLGDLEALSIEVNLASINAILLRRQCVQRVADVDHVVDKVQTHGVEAKAVDLVFPGVQHDGVDHQLLHHLVFAGRIRAAGACLEHTVRVQPVVVVRHQLVHVRLRVLATRKSVIEDNVLDDAEPVEVQGTDHIAILTHTVAGISGIRSLGSHVVDRIVAPVVWIVCLDSLDGSLLLLSVGRIAGQIPGILPRSFVLIDRAEVEAGQQMHSLKSGLRQRVKVPHAVAGQVGKGLVGAATIRGNCVVTHAEVANVQFVNADVVEAGERWRRQ